MELWSCEHAVTLLPAVAVMALIAFGLRVWLKDKSLAVRMIPVQIVTVILLILEVGKQLVAFRNGYDLYCIPLHFCSLFLYVMPVFSFYRGKHSEKVGAVSASLCMSVFLLMMIYPCLIYSADNIRGFFDDYTHFHTVAFHNLVILLLFFILALDLYTPGRGRQVWTPSLFMVCYAAIAAPMAQILQTNFNNFYRCNIPPLETVRQLVENALGYTVAQIAYVLIVVTLDVFFVLLARYLYLLGHKLIHKERVKAV